MQRAVGCNMCDRIANKQMACNGKRSSTHEIINGVLQSVQRSSNSSYIFSPATLNRNTLRSTDTTIRKNGGTKPSHSQVLGPRSLPILTSYHIQCVRDRVQKIETADWDHDCKRKTIGNLCGFLVFFSVFSSALYNLV